MTIILPDDLLTLQFPQPGIVIRARRDKVCRVGAESTIPYPSLVSSKSALKLERLGFCWCLARDWDHGLEILDFPDLGCVVGAASCEMLDVWREEHAGDVVAVCLEVGDGDKSGLFAVLEEVPDIDVALR